MSNSKIAHMTIFFLTKSQCLYIENIFFLLTLYKNIIIGLRTCMVIEYSCVCLNLYIACSYQPTNPEMSIDILHWRFSQAN